MTDALVIPEVAFLRCAALYFENRPTNGEDAAHWANVYNAENCRKAASEIERLRAEVERLTTELAESKADYDCVFKNGWNAVTRAEAAEAERDRLREALEKIVAIEWGSWLADDLTKKLERCASIATAALSTGDTA